MRLFVFGFGYTAAHLAEQARERFATIGGVVQTEESASVLRARGLKAFVAGRDDAAIRSALLASAALVVEELDALLAREGDAPVYRVDVRTEAEFAQGHIPGFWWFPGGQAVQRADEIMILDNGEVLEHGPRAVLAVNPNSRFYALLRTGLEELLA